MTSLATFQKHFIFLKLGFFLRPFSKDKLQDI